MVGQGLGETLYLPLKFAVNRKSLKTIRCLEKSAFLPGH